MKVQIIKKVSSDTGAKQKIIKQRVLSRDASAKRPSSSITMYVNAIPVSIYGFSVSKKGGVNVRKRGRLARAFFREDVKSRRGKTRDKVLQRQDGAGRYPLFEQRVAIIDQAIAVFELNEKGVFEMFHHRFMHEIRWRGGLLG